MNDIAIEVSGLSKNFRLHTQGGVEIEVFRSLDLAVRFGECVALHGPSGCGKSTLLRALYANYAEGAGSIRERHGEGWVDVVGIGRLVLSDWELPAKVLAGEDYRADKKICRTFSDCTTAPRNGIISGCFPLDEHYKNSPEMEQLKAAKSALRERLSST